MNLSSERKLLLLQHAGIGDGIGHTTRVNLWFDATPSAPFTELLGRQCDSQGIQGVECIAPNVVGAEHYKLQLVISKNVNVSRAADAWISAVNVLIQDMPDMWVERMLGSNLDDGMARHSEDTFAWQGHGE